MMRPALLALMLLLLALSGCKKGGDGREDYEAPKGSLGEVLGSMCKTLDRCPDAFGSAIAYRSQNECVAILNFVFTCRLTDEELGDDVTKYSVEQRVPEIDGDLVGPCKAWLADASCEQIARGGSTPCDRVLALDFDDDDNGGEPVGTRGLDEECSDPTDCAPGLYCTGGGGDRELGVTYCSVCRNRQGEGDSCMELPCREDLWCKGNDDGTQYRCAPPEADGFRCSDDSQCASEFCNQRLGDGGGWGECDPGGKAGDPCEDEYATEIQQPSCRRMLACEDGTCQPQASNGGPCTDNYSCEWGNCDDGTQICGLPDGEACSSESQCASVACIDGTCGLSDGQCFLDADCGAGEVCAGACQPPNCECSGCPVGQCTSSGQAGCEDDFECGNGECINGTCSAGRQIGDACSDSFECYPAQCVNGACAAKAAPGASCTGIESCQEPFLCIEGTCRIMNLTCAPARAGERCAWLRVCDDNSWCDLLDNVTCKAKAKVGQVCQTTFQRGVQTCVAGSACTHDEASGEQRCLALPKVGEACTTGCANSTCFNGVCQPLPVGTPCDYDTPCPGDLRCSDDRDICVPPGEAGTSCRDNEECAAGLFCENYNTCVARRGANEACRDTFECDADHYCSTDNYTCVPRLQSGGACRGAFDDVCARGFHCASGTSVCEPARPPGAECDEDRECLSSSCYQRDYCLVRAECTLPE